jgi:hypothetical protein
MTAGAFMIRPASMSVRPEASVSVRDGVGCF